MAHKVHNLGADVIKVALSNRAPTDNDNSFATVGEVASTTAGAGTANGYTAGGHTAALVTSAQVGGVYALKLSNPAPFESTGIMGPLRYAIVYNATAGALIGYYDYGASISLSSGESLAVDFADPAGLVVLG